MQSALSRASRLLWLIAAVAVAALPSNARRQPGSDSGSRSDVPAIHASLSLLAPAAERAARQVVAQRRSPIGPDAALLGHLFPSAIATIGIARAHPQDASAVAGRLFARGYDATAPPLS